MKQDDVLFGYRLQVFALAERTSVAEACRVFGIHRSTYYSWRRHTRPGLAAERDRHPLLVCLAELVSCPTRQPSSRQTSRLARRVAADLARCDWSLERVLSDHGNEFKADFSATLTSLEARHTRIRSGRPQTNWHVENLQKTILDECWRPAFTIPPARSLLLPTLRRARLHRPLLQLILEVRERRVQRLRDACHWPEETRDPAILAAFCASSSLATVSRNALRAWVTAATSRWPSA